MQSPHVRILCVDDNDDTAELIQLMLQSSNADYKIQSVKSPHEALTLAATREFDLYVLDYRFPEMNGVEMCKRIRQINPQTPIMFFTGEAHERERQAALEACADAYLVKPNDIGKLAETAKKLLGHANPGIATQ